LPFGLVFQVAAFCLTIHMLISYLIKGVVVCRALHRAVDPEHSDSSDRSARSIAGWNVVVLVVMMTAWLLANLVPFFGDAVNLMGATLIPVICWMVPIVIFARWYYDAGDARPHVSKLEWCVLALEFVLISVLLVFGTFSAVSTLLEHWHTYGRPFECHCAGMWETCACSADHIGMESLCAAPHLL